MWQEFLLTWQNIDANRLARGNGKDAYTLESGYGCGLLQADRRMGLTTRGGKTCSE